MFNFFKKKPSLSTEEKWNKYGASYAAEINHMVEVIETQGNEAWKGEHPEDPRDDLADEVLDLLKKANSAGKVEGFREKFPPAHSPLIKFFEAKGQHLDQLHFIENEKVVFICGTSYQEQQAYMLEGKSLIKLSASIRAIGKSLQHQIFALVHDNKVICSKGWQGEIIQTFELDLCKDIGITRLIPFNDAKKVLLISSSGIYLIDEKGEKLLHPQYDPEYEEDVSEEEWEPSIDMENACLSPDNQYIVVGDQSHDHQVMNLKGEMITKIGPQSSYPHYCIFSADGKQLLSNSCHFYNGMSIGVSTENMKALKIEAYEESEDYILMDDEMRVYTGIAVDDYYILGDAYGYIRAVDQSGKKMWRYFLGSTIGDITISEDKKLLWVASCTGMIHKLHLDQGQRDTHTIGNGQHYEEFRMILWKGEEEPLYW